MRATKKEAVTARTKDEKFSDVGGRVAMNMDQKD